MPSRRRGGFFGSGEVDITSSDQAASPVILAEDEARLRDLEQLSQSRALSLQDIPEDRIVPNPFQARKTFDVGELAAAIREHGLSVDCACAALQAAMIISSWSTASAVCARLAWLA